jgi:hypothetical protein
MPQGDAPNNEMILGAQLDGAPRIPRVKGRANLVRGKIKAQAQENLRNEQMEPEMDERYMAPRPIGLARPGLWRDERYVDPHAYPPADFHLAIDLEPYMNEQVQVQMVELNYDLAENHGQDPEGEEQNLALILGVARLQNHQEAQDEEIYIEDNDENVEPAGDLYSKFDTLVSLFPKLDPEYLHSKARELSGKDDEFSNWVEATLENQEGLPSREEYDLKSKVNFLYFLFSKLQGFIILEASQFSSS